MYLRRLSTDEPILSKSEEWVFVFDGELQNTTTKRSVLILIFLQGLPVLAAQKDTFTVARVIDGDTIFIRDTEGQLVLSLIY